MTIITFIGAGNSGQAMAVDSKLAGKTVRLFEFEEFSGSIKELFQHKKIELLGKERNSRNFKRNGTAEMDMVTSDIEEAIKGATHVVFSCRANYYETAFKQAIPFFEDGQVISFLPDNYGSMILRRLMKEMGCKKKIYVGGWNTMPFAARIIEKGSKKYVVNVLYRAVQLRFDTMPSKDADDYVELMKEFPPLDTVTPNHGKTMLDIGFSNVNPLLHIPATLYNAGAIDNWGIIPDVGEKDVVYDIYRHGFSNSISNMQWAQYKEESAIAQALNVGIQQYNKEIFYSRTSILGALFMGDDYSISLEKPIPSEDWIQYLPGERFSLKSRYITEDLPISTRLYHELGKMAEVDTPVIDAMIQSASVLNNDNYFEKGFTLKTIGVDNMSKDDLLDYLQHGIE